MPQYKCCKCDETMYSKNPVTRNIFPDDGIAAIMTNIAAVITTKQDNGKRKVTLEFAYADHNPELPDDQLEMEVVNNLRGLTKDEVKHWLCDHEWVLIPGTGEPL